MSHKLRRRQAWADFRWHWILAGSLLPASLVTAQSASNDGFGLAPVHATVPTQVAPTPPADVESAPTELSTLLQRLEAAEAKIADLEGQPKSDASSLVNDGTATADANEADTSALKTQVLDWVNEAKANTYPSLTINGVFQADAGFFQQDALSRTVHGDLQDGADFRRARLSAKGSVAETVNYFMQMDFGFFGRPTFTDVWVEQVDIPGLGNLRVGQWKQPFSLEVVSSFRYTTFMERSLLFQTFTPFRHLGIGFYNHSQDQNWTWAASVFRAGQDQFGGSATDTGGWSTAERLTHLVFWDEASQGRHYLHTGIGHYFSSPPNHSINFRTIPEMYIGDVGADNQVGTSGQPTPGPNNGTPFFVQTGALNVNHYNVLGKEMLWVRGPLSVQSEGMINLVDQVSGTNAVLAGAYAQVGYFLTGEHRPYDRNAGAIDRVKPHENFFCVNTDQGRATGSGAWEIAARFSHLDLNDANIRGGTLDDFTAGVNWYWNPYTKVVFNYIHAWNDSATINPNTQLPFGDNETDIYAARMQIDF